MLSITVRIRPSLKKFDGRLWLTQQVGVEVVRCYHHSNALSRYRGLCNLSLVVHKARVTMQVFLRANLLPRNGKWW